MSVQTLNINPAAFDVGQTNERVALAESAEPQMPDYGSLSIEVLADLLVQTREENQGFKDDFESFMAPRRESERYLHDILAAKMAESGGKLAPHSRYTIEREEIFSAYAFDIARLKEVAAKLPDDQRAKLLKYTPERTVVVPEAYEPGAAVSFTALIKKYAGTQTEIDVKSCFTRSKLGDKLKIKPRVDTMKSVTPTLGEAA